ncbi:uncharacterized protein [Anser cygnoides]|uniref:uncharacterized protein isoform X1 n=1 Tax=Anser cygnoides TaxID=8845 RepID=UPI0006708FB7|nr:uncharacterized protein LOC106044347 isoform X4 [Anser cygnoides]XP_013049784.1 uncharacterized protein LOC106044347 isoform X4 [Anser cygnoides]
MVSQFHAENKQPLSKNRHFKSFQTSPVPPRTEMGQKDVVDSTSAKLKKELEWQVEEISEFHEYKLHRHQQVPCLEDIRHLKVCLQKLMKGIEEKERDIIKEKREILEERELVLQQDNILKDMQIKISHLVEQLKNSELIGLKLSKQLRNQIEALGAGSSQQEEKVDNCTSSPTQKTTMVKQTQTSMTGYLKKLSSCLRNSLWQIGRLLLHSGCSFIVMLLFYKYLSDFTWICCLLKSISQKYFKTCAWPH